MPRSASIDKETKKLILEAREMVEAAEQADCNEAETRRRIERIFELLLGYDAFKNLSREKAVRGVGETEYADFSIQVGDLKKPEVMVEIKRVCLDLAPKHLKQVASYAINLGCEWILLTNSKEWQLYHVSFGQPPVTTLIDQWNLLTDEVPSLAQHFDLISCKNLKRGGLDELWQKANVLHPKKLLQAILSESTLKSIRKELKKDSDVSVSPEEIISGIRRLLNESALCELEPMRICLEKKQSKKRKEVVEEKAPIPQSECSDPTSVLPEITPSETEQPKL